MTSVDDLVTAGRRLAGLGLSPGSSGNLSVRVGDTIVMSPTGSDLATLDAAQLSILDFEGNLLSGPKASKEYPFHRAMYRRSAETEAIVHLHSTSAVGVSCLEPWNALSAIPPITPYFVMRVGQTPLIPYAAPGDSSQAEVIEKLGFPFGAVLLQNHGSITSGSTMSAAVEAAIELEEACKLLLLLGGQPARYLTGQEALTLAATYSSPWTPTDDSELLQ
ncbi:MAG: 3-dehydro-4-phosphotetronate decarboxylase [Microbacteriaceae bacterium]|jgi:ribulose-5-phosphate 4-epimerase/fuculose-1-phosphate aldolase|nr:3-dehydro-4-phosphotetronate decarboxylase [Microbacteriaceae bacterium]